MVLEQPDGDCAEQAGLPNHFVTVPAGNQALRLTAATLIVLTFALLISEVPARYIPIENLLLMGMGSLALGYSGITALYHSGRRNELWLDLHNSRYRARWNTLSEGRDGPISEMSSVSAKRSSAPGKWDVWIAWKSFDINPLRIAVTSEDSAVALRDSLAAVIAAEHAAHPVAHIKPDSTTRKRETKDNPGTLLWFGLFFAVMALPMLFYGLHDRALQGAITGRGRETLGTVTGRRRESTKSGYSYHVSYQFQEGGKTYGGESIVDSITYQGAEYHSPTRVEYLPGDPEANRLSGITYGFGVVFLLFGSVLGAMGLCVAAAGYNMLRKVDRSMGR